MGTLIGGVFIGCIYVCVLIGAVIIDFYKLFYVDWIAAIIYRNHPKDKPKWTQPFVLTKKIWSPTVNLDEEEIEEEIETQTVIKNEPQIKYDEQLGLCNCCGAMLYLGMNKCAYCDASLNRALDYVVW